MVSQFAEKGGIHNFKHVKLTRNLLIVVYGQLRLHCKISSTVSEKQKQKH